MNDILFVENAGFGTTPDHPAARFSVGDIVRRRKRKWLADLPETGVIAAIVPPGFPPEYSVADAAGRPRPLMITKPSGRLRYIMGFEGHPAPVLVAEKDLIEATGEKGEVRYASDAEQGDA